ncbi:MAG: glycosyltransferase [Desulfobacteraceae bacterium]|nr:glycosyltransferase [Desulfobacteraceae bacterium]
MEGTKYVVGDGLELKRIKAMYPDVRFAGVRIHGAELARNYSAADVFVFPSLTDTFGRVMSGALACGVPVAALPVTGPMEVIGDSGAGVLDTNLLTVLKKRSLSLRKNALNLPAGFPGSSQPGLFCSTSGELEKGDERPGTRHLPDNLLIHESITPQIVADVPEMLRVFFDFCFLINRKTIFPIPFIQFFGNQVDQRYKFIKNSHQRRFLDHAQEIAIFDQPAANISIIFPGVHFLINTPVESKHVFSPFRYFIGVKNKMAVFFCLKDNYCPLCICSWQTSVLTSFPQLSILIGKSFNQLTG